MEAEEHPCSLAFLWCRQRALGRLLYARKTHNRNDDHLTSTIRGHFSLFHFRFQYKVILSCSLQHRAAQNSPGYSKPHGYFWEAAILKNMHCKNKAVWFFSYGFWEICVPLPSPWNNSEPQFHHVSHYTTESLAWNSTRSNLNPQLQLWKGNCALKKTTPIRSLAQDWESFPKIHIQKPTPLLGSKWVRGDCANLEHTNSSVCRKVLLILNRAILPVFRCFHSHLTYMHEIKQGITITLDTRCLKLQVIWYQIKRNHHCKDQPPSSSSLVSQGKHTAMQLLVLLSVDLPQHHPRTGLGLCSWPGVLPLATQHWVSNITN